MSDPTPFSDASPRAEGLARQVLQLLRAHVEEPAAPPDIGRRLERFVYGFAQPLWGLRMVVRDRSLLGLALAPVLMVAAVCALVAWGDAGEEGMVHVALRFFAAFAALAPVPPVLFARSYARMSAKVRNEMGLGPRVPYLRGLWDALVESISLVIVVAIGVFPVAAVLGWVPLFGAAWAAGVSALWALHWIVVEAFDTARTLAPGENLDQQEKTSSERSGVPWYARPYRQPMPALLRLLVLPFKVFADIAAGMASRWRPEVDRVEAHPWMMLGFGLGTVVLLAIPGVNLFFRPAIVIGAAHLAGRLDIAETGLRPQTGPTGTQPYPTVA